MRNIKSATRTTKFVVAAVVASIVFAGVYGFAASLGLGSFNLSHSGEQNAENVLEIHDPALAERLAGFVDEVRGRYPVARLDGGAQPASSRPA